MEELRPGEESAQVKPAYRRGFRLGIGGGQAVGKLIAGVILSALLIVAFSQRWNLLVIFVIGVVWAIVVAGLIIVPVVSSAIADFLSQQRVHTPKIDRPTPREHYEEPGAVVQPAPPNRPEAWIGLYLPEDELSSPSISRDEAAFFDWEALVDEVAFRLQTALGEGFSTETRATSFTLKYGSMVRAVNLGAIIRPVSVNVGERALRVCLKMMDESQMFAMRVFHHPWPVRADELEGVSTFPRPRVRLDEGKITMKWEDSHGLVLLLKPLALANLSSSPRHS